jgi:hypothetical protein
MGGDLILPFTSSSPVLAAKYAILGRSYMTLIRVSSDFPVAFRAPIV